MIILVFFITKEHIKFFKGWWGSVGLSHLVDQGVLFCLQSLCCFFMHTPGTVTALTASQVTAHWRKNRSTYNETHSPSVLGHLSLFVVFWFVKFSRLNKVVLFFPHNSFWVFLLIAPNVTCLMIRIRIVYLCILFMHKHELRQIHIILDVS